MSPLTEKDNKGELLWAWSYPTIDSSIRDLMMHKCMLGTDEESETDKQVMEYLYGHLNDIWYYLYNRETKGNVDNVI